MLYHVWTCHVCFYGAVALPPHRNRTCCLALDKSNCGCKQTKKQLGFDKTWGKYTSLMLKHFKTLYHLRHLLSNHIKCRESEEHMLYAQIASILLDCAINLLSHMFTPYQLYSHVKKSHHHCTVLCRVTLRITCWAVCSDEWVVQSLKHTLLSPCEVQFSRDIFVNIYSAAASSADPDSN